MWSRWARRGETSPAGLFFALVYCVDRFLENREIHVGMPRIRGGEVLAQLSEALAKACLGLIRLRKGQIAPEPLDYGAGLARIAPASARRSISE
jgi:hypothetical protein